MSLILITLTLVVSTNQVAAQDATPSAQEQGTPIAIPGSDCTVEPRTAGAIAETVSASHGIGATPTSEDSTYTRPEGTAADPTTVAGVTETIQQLVACVNAGDFMRFLALYSNDALRRYAEELGLPLDPDAPLLTPAPTQNDQIALAAIEDIIVLADGRVSALARISEQEYDGTGEGELALHLILVNDPSQGERWLIDELIPIVPSSDSDWTPVAGEGYRGVIVRGADASDFAQALTGQAGIQGWEPTPDDINKLESELPAFLKTASNAAPDLWIRIANYYRQYAGVIDSDGRQTIFVNAFCDTVTSEWQTDPVLVLDGGDCFFTVTYVVESGTFTRLMINGEA
jgi:hypothetical protein